MNKTWNLKQIILKKIKTQGGWVNTHAHLDRAYTISPKTLPLANAHLHQKWSLVEDTKRRSTENQIYSRMAFAIEQMLAQGVTALGSFIDVDEITKDKAIKAADRVRQKYKNQITLKFINQTLKGVLNPQAKQWFDLAADFVDIIGGLPAKDQGRQAEHLDILLDTARRMNKMVHVHVDQLNTAKEKETELLAQKTKQYQLEGRVVAIHSISIAAHKQAYRQKLYQQMKQANLMVITCPTSWIDARRSEEISPTHNAITPVDELIPAGITVALGTDNIADIYKPFTNGNMWTELRFLLEACHCYDINQLVNIATNNGRKILGIQVQP